MNLLDVVRRRVRRRRITSSTIRYLFSAALSTAAAMSLLALGPASTGSYVYLETPTQAIEVGDVFPVTVYASAATPINAVELQVSFPQDVVDVFGVDRGQSVITIWTKEPEITDTGVTLSGGTFRRGFIGQHELATINLRALHAGQYSVFVDGIRFVAGDGEGTAVAAATHDDSTLSLFNFDENTSPEDISIAVTSQVATDINADGRITLQDISAFMGAWSSRTTVFDFNNDGRMGFRDFSIILADYFLQ